MKTHKAIFISDIHLGTRGCRAKSLISFLKNNDAPVIYLVGDIIDGWRMKRGIYWPQSHSEVLRQLLKKSNNGTKIYFIVGNHDEFLRKWLTWDLRFGNIQLLNRHVYVSSKGQKYLVVHGDMFDSVMKAELKWLMHVGDVAYNSLIWLNTKLNWIRLKLGMRYWSLSKFLKQKTKQALNFIDNFELKLAKYAKEKNFDGVICGHIHHAKISSVEGIHYINTGDWVESCTAIVETENGNFKLIEWE